MAGDQLRKGCGIHLGHLFFQRDQKGERTRWVHGWYLDFRHLDYLKETGKGCSEHKPGPVGEGRLNWISTAKLRPL